MSFGRSGRRDGKEARMDMYSDSGEALAASGLEKHPQK
jgi:hypothetical protein